MSTPIAFAIAAGTIRDRARLAEPTDTVAGFHSVATRRWEDGMALAGHSDATTAAVYMLGYGAEIALKIATCELLGVPPSADPWAWLGSRLSSFGLSGLRDVRTHDVRDLWRQASDRREGLGLDLRDPAFHGALQFHAWRVYTNWWEELRYKNVVATPTEVAEAAESSFWLLTKLTEIYQ